MKIAILFPFFIFFVIVIDYGLSSRELDKRLLRQLMRAFPDEEERNRQHIRLRSEQRVQRQGQQWREQQWRKQQWRLQQMRQQQLQLQQLRLQQRHEQQRQEQQPQQQQQSQERVRELTKGGLFNNTYFEESSSSRIGGHSIQQPRQKEIVYPPEVEKHVIHESK